MVSRTHAVFKADDRSYFAILKKEIHAIALSAGFIEHKIGEIDIIVAEMVSNLVKHAGGGQLLVKLIEENYGCDKITPNLHLSLHLCECSFDYGPLYTFWCFSFKRMNGMLGIILQIFLSH